MISWSGERNRNIPNLPYTDTIHYTAPYFSTFTNQLCFIYFFIHCLLFFKCHASLFQSILLTPSNHSFLVFPLYICFTCWSSFVPSVGRKSPECTFFTLVTYVYIQFPLIYYSFCFFYYTHFLPNPSHCIQFIFTFFLRYSILSSIAKCVEGQFYSHHFLLLLWNIYSSQQTGVCIA